MFSQSPSIFFRPSILRGVALIIATFCVSHTHSTFAQDDPKTTAPYTWVRVTNSAPWNPSDGVGALVYKDRMWLLGGWNPRIYTKSCHNEVWSSGDGVNWREDKPNTFAVKDFDVNSDWEGRHTAGYVVYKDKMWIIGGDPIQKHYQYDVWNSEDGKSWTQINKGTPVPWGPRVLFYTLVFDNKIWVMGGQTMPQYGPADEALYRDIWNTKDGIHWTKVIPKGEHWPARGMIGGRTVFRDKMWILGGGTYDTPKHPTRAYYNDVWSSADGVHWTQELEHAPWPGRQYHDVAVFDGKLWVFEGYDGVANRKDVWYSEDGKTWHELPNTPWKARHAASVFVFKDALWMIQGNNFDKEVWKLVRTPGS